MHPHQRESIVLVQLSYIIHQPIVGGMAAGTIRTDGAAVHILMAGNTTCLGLRKNERFMAGPAIGLGMLTFELKIGFVVVKRHGIPADLPAGDPRKYRTRPVPGIKRDLPPGRRVTGSAIDLEISAVRRLGENPNRQSKENQYCWQSIHSKRIILNELLQCRVFSFSIKNRKKSIKFYHFQFPFG